MIFGDLVGLKFPDICLTGEEEPRKKTSPRKPDPTGDRTRARCVTGAHATTCSTAVDEISILMSKFYDFLLCILHIKNRENAKFELNLSVSFQDKILKLIFITCKFQNVPCVLSFEVKHQNFSVEVSGHV